MKLYRGENPGDSRRIRTGDCTWDAQLFVTDDLEKARDYGATVREFEYPDDAKVLREGSRAWRSLMAGYKPTGGKLLALYSEAVRRAESAGYDLIWFEHTGDTGIVVLNRSKLKATPSPRSKQVIETMVHGKPSGLYGSKPGEHVVAAAVAMGDEVFLADCHFDAKRLARQKLGAKFVTGVHDMKLGFWTSAGRFVDRRQAAEVARAARQADMPVYMDSADMVQQVNRGFVATSAAERHVVEGSADDEHALRYHETGRWGRRGSGSLILAKSTGKILFPLRSDAVLEPGTWGTWGGAIDPGEDPAEAAVREAREEAGAPNAERVVPLYVFREPGFSYHNFLIIVPDEFSPRLNWETSRAEWREFGEWPSPLHPGLAKLLGDTSSLAKIKAELGV